MKDLKRHSRALKRGSAALLLLGGLACSGKSRPFSDDVFPLDGQGGAGGSEMPAADGTPPSAGEALGEGSPDDPALLAPASASGGVSPGSLGAACVSAADCMAPGQCVDGVCCASACTELCAACNVPGAVGTCSAAPADPACAALECAGLDTDCRKLDRAQLSLNCEAFGQCKQQADCASVPELAGTPCQTGMGSCDGAGACVVMGKAGLGASCSADAECAEGHCVAGPDGASLCCDAACDGACQACSATGRCEVAPQQDERCEAVACPADDVCRDYTADVTASQCRSFGQCQTGRDCTFTALRPEAECSCESETGACTLLVGAACSAAEQCKSGACVANGQGTNICCATGCGEGLFCSNDGAACVACEGDAVTCDGNAEKRCNAGVVTVVECPNGCTPGAGCNDLPALGFSCEAGQCAAPNVCQQDVTGQPRCCSRDCAAESKVCAENGSCVCQPGQVQVGADCLLTDGDPCQSSQQCQVGSSCTDGVCCQEACSGTCERCEPNTGLCVAIVAGQQDTLCGAGRQCTGARGDCRLTVRQPCTGNGAECTTNNCEPTVGGATLICCAQACGAERPFCRSDGSSCVECETNADCGNGCNTVTGLCNELLPIGTPCGASAQCASGAQCLLDQSGATRCCERNCAAQGLLCNGAGLCVEPAPATLATVGLPPAPFSRSLVGAAGTETRLWSVQNTGATATALLSLSSSAAASQFSVNGNCLGSVLQAGASCSLNIGFAPRQAGQVSETLTLSGGPGVAISVQVSGDARLPDGADCPGMASLCASNLCTEWFVDLDGDGFGSAENVGGVAAKNLCGSADIANQPPPFILEAGCRGVDVEIPYVARRSGAGITNGGLDCCDRFFRCDLAGTTAVAASNAFPGQTIASAGGLDCGPSPNAGAAFDYDCDGDETPSSTSTGRTVVGLFDATPCAMNTDAAECTAASGRIAAPEGCGLFTVQACRFSDAGACTNFNASQISVSCL
jgi:ASPM-SPD-2-Hydin domain-containing protein